MKNRIPIFRDGIQRNLVDNLDFINQKKDWFPSNKAALLLWACSESLRDILVSLESCIQTNEETKKRRILKNISIPLHSLAKSIIDLCNNLISNKENNKYLTKDKIKEIKKIKNGFSDLFNLDPNSDISTLRNKLAAHIDKRIWPHKAKDILHKTNESVLGTGIHICCHVLIDLLELNIYAWSCEVENHPTFNIMTEEPFLVCFITKDDQPERINCIHNVDKLPRENVFEIIDKIVRTSKWMFNKGDVRISDVSFNSKGNKHPFLATVNFYKKI